MRDAGLIVFRRDDPDLLGQGARDLLAYLEAFGIDAVVVGDEDAHALSPLPLAGEVGELYSPGGGFSALYLPPPQPSPACGGGRAQALPRCSLVHASFSMVLMPPISGASTSGTAIAP